MTRDSSLQKKLRSHLVLLVDRKTGANGSGVLFQIGENVLVITAAHVLCEDLHINLGLPFQVSPLNIVDQWTVEELDLAFLQLKSFEVKIYSHNDASPFRVGRRTRVEIPMGKKRFALYGYPFNERKQVKEGIAYTPLFLGCILLPYEFWPEFVKTKKNPSLHFAIPTGPKHGSHFLGEDGNPMDILPEGMSGCGLWYYDPQTENSERPSYSLLGIQHSYFPQDQIIAGTYVDAAIDAITSRYGPIPGDPSPAAH